jgi:hypothetical protein
LITDFVVAEKNFNLSSGLDTLDLVLLILSVTLNFTEGYD